MNFHIPIYVYQNPRGYSARPLFFAGPERTDGNLNRMLTKLTRELIADMEKLALGLRHNELACRVFCPRVFPHRVPVEIELRRRIARVNYLVLAFDHMGRRLAFTPAVRDLWFEVTRNERLETRTQAVLTAHWRQVERGSR